MWVSLHRPHLLGMNCMCTSALLRGRPGETDGDARSTFRSDVAVWGGGQMHLGPLLFVVCDHRSQAVDHPSHRCMHACQQSANQCKGLGSSHFVKLLSLRCVRAHFPGLLLVLPNTPSPGMGPLPSEFGQQGHGEDSRQEVHQRRRQQDSTFADVLTHTMHFHGTVA